MQATGKDAETRICRIAEQGQAAGELPTAADAAMSGCTGRTWALNVNQDDHATTGLPTGGNTYGNRVSIVAQRPR